MPDEVPEIPVRFYRTTAGREPVLELLRKLEREDRKVIGLDLMRVHEGMLVVLHGFIKKTQKTPANDLQLARRRLREVTG